MEMTDLLSLIYYLTLFSPKEIDNKFELTLVKEAKPLFDELQRRSVISSDLPEYYYVCGNYFKIDFV